MEEDPSSPTHILTVWGVDTSSRSSSHAADVEGDGALEVAFRRYQFFPTRYSGCTQGRSLPVLAGFAVQGEVKSR